MKKQILLAAAVFSVLGCSAWLAFYKINDIGGFRLEAKSEEGEKGESGEAQKAKEAMEWRFERLKDEYGNFNYSYVQNAINQANAFKAVGSRAGAIPLQWEELGPDNVGGRTRAILIDRRDPSHNTVYAGGVGGGLWKSTDGAGTWHEVTGWNQWLAISCITQGPDNTIYVGTGEGLAQIIGTSFNSGTMGNGIFKLDASDNPTRITPDVLTTTLDNGSAWAAVNRIAVNPGNALHIIAATQKGLYQTTDGGGSWTAITISGISAGTSAADVKWSNDGQNIFACVGGNNKVVRSLNGGFQWTKIGNTTNPGFPATQGRIEIAIAPSNSNIVYIAVATPGGATYGVYRSEDAGDSWTNIGLKGPLFDPYGPNNQGWYDNTIAVSPADPNKVYMGGVDLYTWSDQSGWKLADVGLGGGNANPNYIHPDKHAITIDVNDANVMYIGCDGGIYKSINALSAFPFPDYTVKNRGYNVTQQYSVAAARTGEVLGGTQDNGTNYIDFRGNTRMASKQVIGGDGIYAEISHIDPRIFFGGIYFGQVLRSGNAGASFDGMYDTKIDPQGHTQPSRCGGQKDANAPFITPFFLQETKTAANGVRTVPFVADRNYTSGEVVTAESQTSKFPFQYTLTADLTQGDTVQVPDLVRSRMFVTSNCGAWVTSEALDKSTIPKWNKLMSTMSGLAYSYTTSPDGDVMYIGTSSGAVYRLPNLNARCDTAPYPIGANAIGLIYTSTSQFTQRSVASGRAIEGVAVDPNNSDHVVAAVAGFSSTNAPHVYESTDGGLNWTPLTTGLPNMPVYDVVFNPYAPNNIIIGSELGMWSWDGSTWTEENNGLPRVPVYRLIIKPLYEDGCQVLYIGTHGRGMWRSTSLLQANCNATTGINDVKNDVQVANLNIFPNPVSSTSKIALSLDKPADVTFRVFDMSGRLYREFTYRNAIAGENLFELDASNLVTGTYILSATLTNGRTQSRLFTVSK